MSGRICPTVWRILSIALLLLLAGCGFHLRGSGPGDNAAGKIESLYIESLQPDGSLMKALRTALKHQASVVDHPQQALITLHLGNEQVSQQAVSYSRTADAAEYRIKKEISLRITGTNARELVAPSRLAVEQIYTSEIDRITSDSGKRDLLLNELDRRLSDQIIRQLRAAQVLTRSQR